MKTPNQTTSRRSLLAAAGLAGAAGATLAVMSRQPDASSGAAAVKDLPKPEKGGGYALTEHVKRYYQTTRI